MYEGIIHFCWCICTKHIYYVIYTCMYSKQVENSKTKKKELKEIETAKTSTWADQMELLSVCLNMSYI